MEQNVTKPGSTMLPFLDARKVGEKGRESERQTHTHIKTGDKRERGIGVVPFSSINLSLTLQTHTNKHRITTKTTKQ